jgi:hypothetical protein
MEEVEDFELTAILAKHSSEYCIYVTAFSFCGPIIGMKINAEIENKVADSTMTSMIVLGRCSGPDRNLRLVLGVPTWTVRVRLVSKSQSRKSRSRTLTNLLISKSQSHSVRVRLDILFGVYTKFK